MRRTLARAHGMAKRRRVSPRALPGVARPRPSNGSEHVSAEDPGARVQESPSEEVVVDPGRSSVLAVHALERPCGEDPLAQHLPADAHRILEALIWSGSESVDGNGEAHFNLENGLGSYRSI